VRVTLQHYVWKATPRQRSLDLEQYRNFLTAPAVYKLHNVREGEIYIGCTQNARRRFSQHLSLMGSADHHNRALRDWNPNNVTFYVIEMFEQCDAENLRGRERYWQDLHLRRSRTTRIVSRHDSRFYK